MAPPKPPLPPAAAAAAATVTLTVVLLLHLIAPSEATKTTNHATSYPSFQHFNVKEAILTSQIQHPPKPSQQNDAVSSSANEKLTVLSRGNLQKPIKLDLIHRDNLPTTISSTPLNLTRRFFQRIHRDVIHVALLTGSLSHHRTAGAGSRSFTAAEFGSDVISGMEQGSGEYFVRIGVGSPPRAQYVVVDTGSDVVWVQCQPCNSCYKQSDPVFDPAESASFSTVSCRSKLCNRIYNSGCHSGRCRYEVFYSDGSYTQGTLALETLTIGSTQIRSVAIGCGHVNRGMFVGAAGLLGLARSSLSLVGQLGGQTGGAFSYCLVSRGSGPGPGSESGSTGYLVFGRDSLPVGAAWINLIRNPQAPGLYYIGLSGLGVGGVRVPVSDTAFELTASGEGGVVMDTGTAVTRLPADAYAAFRDAFVEQTRNLPRAPGVSIFDTCYDLSGFVLVRVPTVSFYFSDGPALTLPARSFLVAVDDTGTFCLAFAASDTRLSIIGNIQQEGIRISVDGANGFVGFGPDVC